ncbi:protein MICRORCHIDIA 6-like [Phalaenopsis equestris]|uniref:protein MICRORCHIDIA 6-like n=1 Tax=Phalaenopsis equestris TaxID=78828 RepID=UPI0009E5890B|nr:protein MICRORCHIDIA 6-like [Phalaenopsis equestris]
MNRTGFVEIGSIDGLPNSSSPEIRNSALNPFSQSSTSHNFLPECRQFWKAGEYSAGDAPRSFLKTYQNRMRVHPKFLHSNATSHKWPFGAIAELLDNAVDEACNRATSVIIDEIANFGNSHGLLIQDNGGGMDPESIRRCMSFGFSNKKSDSLIGHYGNGFKTSTMRLGADVIVFSRCSREGSITRSVGILSYTFLRQTGCDDVLVPMVDYNFDSSTQRFVRMISHSEKQFGDNLSALLRWSPFSKEENLLNQSVEQFDHIEGNGTRIIVFNLWLNDNGDPELDFDTNEKDITISGTPEVMRSSWFARDLNDKHIGIRFHYSLRAYASILYLRLPSNFSIFLRGQLVDPHYIAEDLMYTQCIKYKPQVAGTIEAEEIGTVIGFLKGAPHLNIHGFNIYHRCRLIMPFWPVVQKCRGVVGVLQVDCLKPTHDKQGFERSDIFLKLEARLKCMALEYWKYHCHLIGYNAVKVPSPTLLPFGYQIYSQDAFPKRRKFAQEVMKNPKQLQHFELFQMNSIGGASQFPSSAAHLSYEEVDALQGQRSSNYGECSQAVLPEKENYRENIYPTEVLKKQSVTAGLAAPKIKPQIQIQHGGRDRKQALMVQRRKQLNERCMELERSVEELTLEEQRLRSELEVVKLLNDNLCADLKSVGNMDGL